MGPTVPANTADTMQGILRPNQLSVLSVYTSVLGLGVCGTIFSSFEVHAIQSNLLDTSTSGLLASIILA